MSVEDEKVIEKEMLVEKLHALTHAEIGGARLDEGDYTLLIPTYRRPVLLRRLLSFLQANECEAPIIILDSSPHEDSKKNILTVKESRLNVILRSYDPNIHPYTKMYDGLKNVKTEFVSAVADDDIVVVPTLRKLLVFMRKHSDFAAAHGIYVNFRECPDFLQVSFVEQRDSEVTDNKPIDRLNSLMSNYSVIFYALHRTACAVAAFSSVANFATTLCGELSTGILVAIQGKVKRIDDIYIGRNTDESMSYSGWHPHQLLADRPIDMFRDYMILRECIIDALQKNQADLPECLDSIVDLIALSYLAPFVKIEHLQFMMIEKMLDGANGRETYDRFWNKFVRPQRPILPTVELFLDEGRTFSPGVQDRNGPEQDYRHSVDAGSRTHAFVFHNEFFHPNRTDRICTLSRSQTELLIEQLAAYVDTLDGAAP